MNDRYPLRGDVRREQNSAYGPFDRGVVHQHGAVFFSRSAVVPDLC